MINRIITNTTRNIMRLQTYATFYIGLAFVIFVIFGIFGIIPLALNIKDKVMFMQKMQQLNLTLEEKHQNLGRAEILLEENDELITEFYSYLPQNYYLKDYLVDFSNITAIDRFNLMRFANSTTEKNIYADIAVYLEGSGSVPQLILDLEKLKGFTNIYSINVVPVFEDGIVRVNLNLRTYAL